MGRVTGGNTMRHTRLITFIFSLLTAILLSGSAFADSMKFIAPGGNNSGGVYTYPYNFTVNGQSAQLLCDTFDNDVVNGETWTATEHSIPGSERLFDPTDVNAVTDYEAAGIIFDGILGINGFAQNPDTNDANWAIWAIFSPTALGDIAGNATALSIYNTALTAAANSPSATDFTGIVVYTPEAGSQSGQSKNGTPQEYLGYTPVPEPSELSLLGILALFGITGFAFRKRLSSACAINFQQ